MSAKPKKDGKHTHTQTTTTWLVTWTQTQAIAVSTAGLPNECCEQWRREGPEVTKVRIVREECWELGECGDVACAAEGP